MNYAHLSPSFLKYIVPGSVLLILSIAYIGSSIFTYADWLWNSKRIMCIESCVMPKGWLDPGSPLTILSIMMFGIGVLLIALYFCEESSAEIRTR
jgi:hypothetical protein